MFLTACLSSDVITLLIVYWAAAPGAELRLHSPFAAHTPLREERPQQCDRKPWGVSVGDCGRVHAGPAVGGVPGRWGRGNELDACQGFRCWLRVQDKGQGVGKNLWYVGMCGCLDGGT